jgi:putative transcriptional regulator
MLKAPGAPRKRAEAGPGGVRRVDRTDVRALRAMTEAEITAAARSDPDAPPLSVARLARLRPLAAIDVRALRARLGLSQAQFAARFGFGLKTVQDWEQDRRKPTGPARVLLNMIASSPRTVERLAARRG